MSPRTLWTFYPVVSTRKFAWLFSVLICSGCVTDEYIVQSGSRCSKQATRGYIVGLLNQKVGSADGPPSTVASVDLVNTAGNAQELECGGTLNMGNGTKASGWVRVTYGNGLRQPPTDAHWIAEAQVRAEQQEKYQREVAAERKRIAAYHPDASGKMYARFECVEQLGQCRQLDPGGMTIGGHIPGRLYPTKEECEAGLPKAVNGIYFECLGKHIDAWEP